MIYRIFEGCRLIEGYERCAVYDLQHRSYKLYPKAIAKLINANGIFSNNFHLINDEDFQYIIGVLEKDEIIFPIEDSEIERFPNLDLNWEYPSHISNCIIVWNSSFFEQYKRIIKKDFLHTNCRHFQFQIYHSISTEHLQTIQELINDSIVQSVEYFMNKNAFDNEELLKSWVLKNRKIRFISINGATCNSIISKGENRMGIIVNTAEKISSPMQCGNIHRNYFNICIECFTESQCHNTCLNRKVCIDAEGNIKNCPAMAKSYGNIMDTTLEEAINKPGFKDLWYINKDRIDVCKDCEFRHICTDCRAFIKDPSNIFSQPAKCPYNPYICKWNGEDGYVPVEECGTYSHDTGFVPDKKKIRKLNREIWGEEE